MFFFNKNTVKVIIFLRIACFSKSSKKMFHIIFFPGLWKNRVRISGILTLWCSLIWIIHHNHKLHRIICLTYKKKLIMSINFKHVEVFQMHIMIFKKYGFYRMKYNFVILHIIMNVKSYA